MEHDSSICGGVDNDRREQLSLLTEVPIRYRCPECGHKVSTNLLYFPTKWGRVHPQTAVSNLCARCGTRNTLEYRVFKRRDGSHRLKSFKMMSGDRQLKRGFKFEWYD